MSEDKTEIPNPLDAGIPARLLKKVRTSWIVEGYRDQTGLDVSYYFSKQPEIILAECCKTGYRFFYPFNLAGGSELYEKVENFDWYYVPWKWEHEKSLDYIKETDSVLEIGCGRGDYLNSLKSRGNSVVGLEMNHSAAAYAREKFGLDIYTSGLLEYTTTSNRQFDVVCMFQVLEHISDTGEFIRQSISCLKPGGRLIIGVPNMDSVIVKDEPNNILDYPPHHMGWWNSGSLKNLSKVFPLEVMSINKEIIPKDRLKRYYFIQISKLRRRFGIIGKIVDKLIYPVSETILLIFRKLIPGHTIIAVYRKGD